MQIVFGWKLDGPSYPLTAIGSESAIGQPVVGPNGLLNLLETPLGLAGPSLPAAVRIARYLGGLPPLSGPRSKLWSDPLGVVQFY